MKIQKQSKRQITGNDVENEVDDFADYWRLNLWMLWWMGIIVDLSEAGLHRSFRLVERLPTFVTNFFGSMDGIFQMLWMYDMWSTDPLLVTQISSNFLSNVTVICKGLRLATAVKPLNMALHEISALWRLNKPVDSVYRDRMLTKAARMHFYCKIYASVGAAFLVAWGWPPIQNVMMQYLEAKESSSNYTYDYSQRIFMVRYPFAVNSAPRFMAVLLEEQWVLFGSVLAWLCSDTLFAQLSTHICLQLQILKDDIEHLIDREEDEVRLKRSMMIFAKRHQNILRICDKIETIFSPIVFNTVLITSMNICVNVFELRVVIVKRDFVNAFVHIVLLFAMAVQILVYCMFAELLTGQTSSIGDAIYNCRWTDKSPKFRIYLQIFIIKAQNPFYFTACGFFPINHQQITTIVKGATSYYMYLQTTG